MKVIGSVGGVIVAYANRFLRTDYLGMTSVSSEPSRVKLYRKLAPKLAKKIGWAGAVEHVTSDSVTQVLYKVSPPSKIKKKKKRLAPSVAEVMRP